MIILQGNTYLLPIQVRDCNDNVITADKVTKGQFIFGKYEKFYGEEGEVQWSEQLQAFLFPLTEQETFELNGVIKYQARLLLNDGSVSGSVPENYYVYESITKNIISNGEVGQESGALLKVKLVMPVVSENNGSGGTSDYNQLENKPKINGVTLQGNKTTEELGIVSEESDPTVPDYVKNISEQDIENWNNKVDTTVDNLVNYYLKKDTYSKDEVNQLISAIRSLKKEIVSVLPIENIDENTIYLVPKTSGSGNDYYDEYLYINGNFEFIGSTQIDLTDYVKNTDYATNIIAGIVKVNPNDGIGIGNTSKALFISPATQTEIDGKTSTRKPIVPATLDYSIKVGMTTNTEEWTNEEKEKARNLIGVPTITATQLEDGSYSLTIE